MIRLDASGENLEFSLGPPIIEIPNGAQPENEGKIRAICHAAEKLGEALGVRLRRHGGTALFIDYGYDYRMGETALGDTLQALRQHKSVPVLDAPGTADLTAHVDFAAFARASANGGAQVYGPVTQRDFLLRLGLEARKATLLAQATPEQAAAIESGAQRLIDPRQMGSLFKALALGQKGAPAPLGFLGERG
jgi:NADH dehydrogenase [ubiquinone] 1 alpha subcomplex assembly factor 7